MNPHAHKRGRGISVRKEHGSYEERNPPMKCVDCGKNALYAVAGVGYCKEHREAAKQHQLAETEKYLNGIPPKSPRPRRWAAVVAK